MTTHSRRSFLRYVGYGALAASAIGPLAACRKAAPAHRSWVLQGFSAIAHPVPVFGDGGDAATDPTRLARFEERDALVLPDGFRARTVASWGDRWGEVAFGYNNDYTGLIPRPDGDFWLWVNHEYVSFLPWTEALARRGVRLVDDYGAVAGFGLLDGGRFRDATPEQQAGLRALAEAHLREVGGTLLHVRRDADGTFAVVADATDHLRVWGHGHSAGVALSYTGPAKALLASAPRGTLQNCSGGTTPWGTILTCEENTQDDCSDLVDCDGHEHGDWPIVGEPAGRGRVPYYLTGLGTALEPPLDGRAYGWVCEIDPEARTLAKHTALGRFRHENCAIRAVAGEPLAVYMGDDRRGGHTWKFVSADKVVDPTSKDCSRLLERGTLHVARFSEDFTGTWIPLVAGTPLATPLAGHTADGFQQLPARPDGGRVAVGVRLEGTPAKVEPMAPEAWIAAVEAFCGKPFAECTLGDLCRGDVDAVLMLDAFAMANACGGTPTARPEDLEVHPVDGSVYVSYTDATGSADGSPDHRIFPDSRRTNSRQYGAIYRLVDEPGGTTFTWGRYVASGELAEGGGGFACCDNLAFDAEAQLWVMCDVATEVMHTPVDRAAGTRPGEKRFAGVFGNNAMFAIELDGGVARPIPFLRGPMECELTGPTFTADGATLVVSVQHPGEHSGTRRVVDGRPEAEVRRYAIAARDGAVFEQERVVPIGSSWPGEPGEVPRPAVVCIVRDR